MHGADSRAAGDRQPLGHAGLEPFVGDKACSWALS
ncbi:hypothetical protein RS9917_12035 [Synechococcus sp. RS9917]|nr:hypothetical protein RS9917_12035 [Synechococcus sp. RS9917]